MLLPPEITPENAKVRLCDPPDGIVIAGLNVKIVVDRILGAVTVTVPAGTLFNDAVSVIEVKICGRLTVTLTEVTTCWLTLVGV